jgi:proline racemase
MGVATVIVERKMITVQEPETKVCLETPAGLITARVGVADGRATAVTLEMCPSFCQLKGVQMTIRDFGDVLCDVAFGGDYYAIVDITHLGIPLVKDEALSLAKLGNAVREAVQKNVHVSHPDNPDIRSIYQVMLTSPVKSPIDIQNVVICPPGVIDRSPCGTGTSAYMALQSSKGALKPGDTLKSTGILGTTFTGQALPASPVGEFAAIQPRITGNGYIIGFGRWVLDPNDPFPEGYSFFRL